MSHSRRARYKQGHVEIEVRDDLEKCIRKLKKMLKEDGILEEYRERTYYEKPSDKKRKKRALARYNSQNNIKNNSF